jgi:hypothetical protein
VFRGSMNITEGVFSAERGSYSTIVFGLSSKRGNMNSIGGPSSAKRRNANSIGGDSSAKRGSHSTNCIGAFYFRGNDLSTVPPPSQSYRDYPTIAHGIFLSSEERNPNEE